MWRLPRFSNKGEEEVVKEKSERRRSWRWEGRAEGRGGWWSAMWLGVVVVVGAAGPWGSLGAAESPTDLYNFANLNYEYGRYEQAAQKYTTFLRTAPDHPGAIPAWFRLGDCYRRLNHMEQANQCFRTYLVKAPNGEYAAPAALALARFLFNKDDYEEAAGYFQVAVEKLTEPVLKAETRFFYAQALQFSNQKEKARKEYALLLAGPRTEFQDRAELELAKLLLEEGKSAEALKLFAKLAEGAKEESIRDEAGFRAGVLNLEAEKPEEAEAFLAQTLAGSKNLAFRQIAQMALIDRAYRRKDYGEVIRLYAVVPVGAKGKAKAQLEMMFANALRNKGQLAQAIRIFGEIEREFRGTPEGNEAGYRKLLVFHEVNDKDLPRFADEYVASMRKVDAESSYIDLALLLKGETLFQKKLYEAAATAYAEVRMEKVDGKYAAMRLYKMGWAYAESGNAPMAIDVLGDFVAQFPKDPLAAAALIKRAMTYSKLQDFKGALRDFSRVVKDYPVNENLEYAMHQVALVLRHERRVKEMVAAYQALLAKFPGTHVRPEAVFWIGGGLFDLKQYRDCVEPLREARQRDPDEYKEKVSLRLVFAHYHLEQTAELLQETDAYLTLFGDREELVPVYGYLGRQLFDQGNFAKAEPYLKKRADPKNPRSTPADIWRKLADIHLAGEKHEEAVEDLKAFLQHDSHVEIRARAMLDLAGCQLKLGLLEEGKGVAEDVLRLVRSGRLNAEARTVLGDLAMANEAPEEAVQHYVIVAEFGGDAAVVPRALHRLSAALEKMGKMEEAASYREELRVKYPGYQPEDT